MLNANSHFEIAGEAEAHNRTGIYIVLEILIGLFEFEVITRRAANNGKVLSQGIEDAAHDLRAVSHEYVWEHHKCFQIGAGLCFHLVGRFLSSLARILL